MSKKQIDIALKMIRKSQKELGHDFNLEDFEDLVSVGLKNKNASNKDAQKIIADMLGQSKNRIKN